jgi:hypothetical protein
MRRPSIHHAFVSWLEAFGSRLIIDVHPTGRTGRLSFEGINPAIGAFLTSRELSVFVEWEGRNWDSLLSLGVMPRRSAGGYVCECCKPVEPTEFPDLEGLWRDHLFEPLLKWVNDELASAHAICLYGSPSQGVTHAVLLLPDDLRQPKPDICIPLRVSGQL